MSSVFVYIFFSIFFRNKIIFLFLVVRCLKEVFVIFLNFNFIMLGVDICLLVVLMNNIRLDCDEFDEMRWEFLFFVLFCDWLF